MPQGPVTSDSGWHPIMMNNSTNSLLAIAASAGSFCNFLASAIKARRSEHIQGAPEFQKLPKVGEKVQQGLKKIKNLIEVLLKPIFELWQHLLEPPWEYLFKTFLYITNELS
jgi:hypothetical protein